jgi:hypothetical protein
MIDNSIILQADATVIAGSLVLLTILYTLLPRSSQEVAGDKASLAASNIAKVIRIFVMFFSVSAILVILGDILGSYTITLGDLGKYTIMPATLGKYAMVLGFGALSIGIVWLVRPMSKSWSLIQKG